MRSYKRDANGGGGFRDFAGGGQGAGGGIDAEDYDVVGLLVGGEEEFAGRVDGEVARSFAHGRIFVFHLEGAFRWVDGEGGDGVDVGAVGGVEEFPAGVNGDLRCLFWTRIVLMQRRKSRNCLQRGERAVAGFVGKGGD